MFKRNKNEEQRLIKNNSKVIKELDDDILEEEDIREIIVEEKSGFNTIEVVVIIIISVLFGIIVGTILTYSRNNVITTSKVSKELSEFVATYESIVDNYYDDVDESTLLDAAVEGMLGALNDPYSSFMDTDESSEFNETIDGSYSGIGATVGTSENGFYVVNIAKDSPADKAGLKVDDIIKEVNGKDVSSLDLEGLTELVKGDANTIVKIKVLRGEKEKNIKITRNTIELTSVTSKVFEENNKKIGYITIDAFASNTYKQFKNRLKKLEKKEIDSLIIDVRSNPGGHLNQVTKILELFMDKKKVLYQIEVKNKKTKVYSTTDEKRNLPVAVLIDSGSASAAEILAAAFKDSYENINIVGVSSYGKGTVQNSFKLSTGASLKYTTEKWLTPKGKWVDEKGVTPTDEVELSDEFFNNPTEETDNQLQEAIKILSQKEESK